MGPTGKRKMHKGSQNRFVDPQDIQKFLEDGYSFGLSEDQKQKKTTSKNFRQCAKGKKWVTDGVIQKLVLPEELEYYFSLGYYLGQSNLHNERVSKAKKGVPMSEEQKKRISKTSLGKKRTQETKDRISQALKGKKKSKEHIEKIASQRRGKHLSQEWRQHLSEGQKKAFLEGRRNPDTFGRKKGRLSRINGHLLRSRAELIYAAYLEYLSIPYETEKIRVMGEDNHIKISDFSYNNVVIEIKMNWEINNRQEELEIRKNAFEKCGYQFKIINENFINNILQQLLQKTKGLDEVLMNTSPDYTLDWTYDYKQNKFMSILN